MSCPQTAALTCKYGRVTKTLITASFALCKIPKPVKATENTSNGLQQVRREPAGAGPPRSHTPPCMEHGAWSSAGSRLVEGPCGSMLASHSESSLPAAWGLKH